MGEQVLKVAPGQMAEDFGFGGYESNLAISPDSEGAVFARKIEALFADSREHRYGEPIYDFKVICNGAFKEEGQTVGPWPDDYVNATLNEIRRLFPNAASERLVWRRRPTYGVSVGFNFGTGALAPDFDTKTVSIRIRSEPLDAAVPEAFFPAGGEL